MLCVYILCSTEFCDLDSKFVTTYILYVWLKFLEMGVKLYPS